MVYTDIDGADTLAIFTVYMGAIDYPRNAVCRRYTVRDGCPDPIPDPEPCILETDLARVCSALNAMELLYIAPSAHDHHSVVGTWV